MSGAIRSSSVMLSSTDGRDAVGDAVVDAGDQRRTAAIVLDDDASATDLPLSRRSLARSATIDCNSRSPPAPGRRTRRTWASRSELVVINPVRGHAVVDHVLPETRIHQQAAFERVFKRARFNGVSNVMTPDNHHQIGGGIHVQPRGIDAAHLLSATTFPPSPGCQRAARCLHGAGYAYRTNSQPQPQPSGGCRHGDQGRFRKKAQADVKTLKEKPDNNTLLRALRALQTGHRRRRHRSPPWHHGPGRRQI